MPKRILRFLLSFTICLIVSYTAKSQGFLHAGSGKVLDGNEKPVLLRGIGLGGWMLQEGYMLKVKGIPQQQHSIRKNIAALVGSEKTDEFYAAWLANHTTRADIEALKSWGFNSVRLPMHYNLYTLPVEQEPVKGQNTWLQKGFDLTDSLLSWCRDNKIYLILDLHGAPGGQGHDLNISDADTSRPFLWESIDNQQKTIALWEKLAARYKDEIWIGAYDIINEPNWGFADLKGDPNGLKETGNAPLRKLMVDITAAIRKVDNNHMIIIEGNGWGNNYNGVFPPWDKNMAISFHKYWNYNTQESIQRFIDYREKYQLPIWLGETGENSNTWFTGAIDLMERNGIGWCWWPLKKLGINNPLTIPTNDGYEKILSYWQGQGEKPSAAEAYESLMLLARQTNFNNCSIRNDVIDAMFRQVQTTATRPFQVIELGRTATIPAYGYDLGRNNFAYYDLDSANYWVSNGPRGGNQGHIIRNDGVDIGLVNNLPTIIHTESGEWLQYTLDVKKAGTYTMSLTYNGKGKIRLEAGSRLEMVLPSLPENGSFGEVKSAPFTLNKGLQSIRIQFIEGGSQIQSINLTAIDQ